MSGILETAYWLLDTGLNFAWHAGIFMAMDALLLAFLGLRRLSFVLALGAALCLGWAAQSTSRTMPLDPQSEGVSLRVMTFNILVFSKDYDTKLAFIRDQGADVVLVQETNPLWWDKLQGLRDTYPHMRQEGPVGTVILSRYPLTTTQGIVKQNWPSWYPARDYLEPGDGLIRGLKVGVDVNGTLTTLVSVHLTKPTSLTTARMFRWEMTRLKAILEDTPGPLILGGDFNATASSLSFQAFASQTGLRGVMPRIGLPMGTWPAAVPWIGVQIDHLMARGPVALKGYEVPKDASSNHRPVVADFAITAGAGGSFGLAGPHQE